MKKTSIKVNFVLECIYKLSLTNENIHVRYISKACEIFFSSNLDQIISEAFQKIILQMDEKILSRSGWSLSSLENIHLLSSKY